MMKRLMGAMKGSGKFVFANVVFQWLSLLANMAIMGAVAYFLDSLWKGRVERKEVFLTLAVSLLSIAFRAVCTVLSSRMSFLSSKAVEE